MVKEVKITRGNNIITIPTTDIEQNYQRTASEEDKWDAFVDKKLDDELGEGLKDNDTDRH